MRSDAARAMIDASRGGSVGSGPCDGDNPDPACAQACPTDAIVFGNINDPSSKVAKLKAHPRNYGILRDINTKPRTSYLGRVRNPNMAIEKLRGRAAAAAGHHG